MHTCTIRLRTVCGGKSVKNVEIGNTNLDAAARRGCKGLMSAIVQRYKSEFITGWKQELFNDKRNGHFCNKLCCYRT